jgi:hypothetical protein
LLWGIHQLNNSKDLKNVTLLFQMKCFILTGDGLAMSALIKTSTVSSNGTRSPAATIFLILSPSLDPYF